MRAIFIRGMKGWLMSPDSNLFIEIWVGDFFYLVLLALMFFVS